MNELSKTDSGRILDFGAVGMWWQITQTAQDTQGSFFAAIHVLVPRFEELPQHLYPHAEKSYQILEGILEVYIDGQWRLLKPGETVTVPMGTPHTLRNSNAEAVRLISIHKPALGFERFFRRMHILFSNAQMTFPPRNVGSLLRLSMLVVEHEKEIRSASPPHGFLRFLAFTGSLLGYTIPD